MDIYMCACVRHKLYTWPQPSHSRIRPKASESADSCKLDVMEYGSEYCHISCEDLGTIPCGGALQEKCGFTHRNYTVIR